MKKLLVGIAALSIGATAMADISTSGDTRLRYTNLENAKGADSSSEAWQMVNTLSLMGNKGDNLSYSLKLRHIGNFGERAGVLPSATDQSTQTNDLVFVQEAIATAKVSENGAFIFGRSGLELNSGELVSTRPFEDTNIAFDGIRYLHDADWGRLGLSYSVAGKSGTNRIKLRGLSYTFKNMPSAISNLELHYVAAKADGTTLATAAGGKERTWAGLNVAGEAGMFDYRVNYENFTGKSSSNTDLKAAMMDIELGYKLSYMDSRVWLRYHDDGATDDSIYDSFYYNDHKYSGLMDVVQWGNLNEVALGYDFKLSSACEAGLAYHKFQKSKDTQTGTLQQASNTAADTSTINAAADKDLGSEINLWYKHTYDSGLFLNAELGQFTVGDAFGTSAKDITSLYVETGFEF